MRTLQLEKKRDAKEFLSTKRTPAKFAKAEDFSVVIDSPARITDANGNCLAVFLEAPKDSSRLLQAIRRVKYPIQDRTRGMRGRSQTFGAMPRRTFRQDYCRRSSLDSDHPDVYEVLCEFGQVAADLVKEHWEYAYTSTLEYVSSISDEWKLPCGVFTSGIINKPTALWYHRDKGNFPDNISAMYVFQRDVEGGELCLPEYDAAISFKRPGILVFQGQNIVHGVTPISSRSSLSYRYSVVFYAMKSLLSCGTCREELERIRALRVDRETRRAAAKPEGSE